MFNSTKIMIASFIMTVLNSYCEGFPEKKASRAMIKIKNTFTKMIQGIEEKYVL